MNNDGFAIPGILWTVMAITSSNILFQLCLFILTLLLLPSSIVSLTGEESFLFLKLVLTELFDLASRQDGSLIIVLSELCEESSTTES